MKRIPSYPGKRHKFGVVRKHLQAIKFLSALAFVIVREQLTEIRKGEISCFKRTIHVVGTQVRQFPSQRPMLVKE